MSFVPLKGRIHNSAATDPGLKSVEAAVQLLKASNNEWLEILVNYGFLDIEDRFYPGPRHGVFRHIEVNYSENNGGNNGTSFPATPNPAIQVRRRLRKNPTLFVASVALRDNSVNEAPIIPVYTVPEKNHNNAVAQRRLRNREYILALRKVIAARKLAPAITRAALNPHTELGQRRLFREMGLPWEPNAAKRKALMGSTMILNTRNAKRQRRA